MSRAGCIAPSTGACLESHQVTVRTASLGCSRAMETQRHQGKSARVPIRILRCVLSGLSSSGCDRYRTGLDDPSYPPR